MTDWQNYNKQNPLVDNIVVVLFFLIFDGNIDKIFIWIYMYVSERKEKRKEYLINDQSI